ncbi:5-methyltetrahydropteroyltriglutamate--homocysteine S-methyltransferase [Helicobacter cappadocius]|uniref:5-methyltetrahydropteroyltriglutamate--homocysteine methyltransferase n=1 Tax=Helicobacter cappadocius TaxID=3063998 RepID=A0AA90PJ68_9HELI|nr:MULTISPECIES: 5-methyltetrahydropteroyltriglutamate--homocysteine S-methyltransferase [unclassified Helicobacter]MDO7253333.1 5-methyltetrahydropteroyltriglutamate--homocysteine S-methyltransferase [Helicobacter sp. faydin-H75]MDP2539237.1 5-methyltetrahydropteroyltriglutamate--homocysteine S-methyltransferase [Helicobacter sp. faydin-H76]
MGIIVGFPRIGEHRELKKSLESFWSNKISEKDLEQSAKELRSKHWSYQKNFEYVSVNDFSLYDNMLDLAYMLGAIPQRFRKFEGLELYFGMARGIKDSVACEMTKWFNTNYHYVVPELSAKDNYNINITKIQNEYKEAKSLGYRPKINLIGLFTFVSLSKIVDDSSFENVFENVKNAYFKLLDNLKSLDSSILIQFEEPIFARGEDKRFYSKIKDVYNQIAKKGFKTIVTTYFEHSTEATEILSQSDIDGIGLDFLYGDKNLTSLETIAKSGKTLYAGVIDGRNIWIADIDAKLELLQKISSKIPKDKIILSSSCSLLHTPFSKDSETKMNAQALSWLSFAKEKIQELELLESLFKNGINPSNEEKYKQNKAINDDRKKSSKIGDVNVQEKLKKPLKTNREVAFKERIKLQHKELNYPLLPTTTIGSFPQTPELRALRQNFKKEQISIEEYEKGIKHYINECVAFQEEIGLDVLVHGEPERNDMVEYFGEQLKGFVFSENGWVQSYGSRCVKPPIIYADVSRPSPMTIKWATYAQSLTKKIVKGMLTGPVTILNWSFVRDDIPRSEVCKQIALGIADEIDDLQNANIKIIQVDEAAFKEGYPLRKENIKTYEKWALECFKISTSIAKPQTQIHTHMCYSEFNDIIKTIEDLDADVISIETARSGNELLKIFAQVGYSHEVGPGVYDIHSPRIPTQEEIIHQIKLLLEVLPKEQLWINPDCGLKTRKWEEVKPSLKNLVLATKHIRENA